MADSVQISNHATSKNANLIDQVAVIGGGAGDVGEGIVRTFLQADATVVVPSRSHDKLKHLRNTFCDYEKRLITFLISRFDDTDLARVLSETLSQFGRIDAVVAALGGWWQGEQLTQTDAATWQKLLDSGLMSHLVMIRTFVPVLSKNGGSYTLINGGAALAPVPNAAAMSVIAAAQIMLARALTEETRNTKVRVNQLILNSITATRARHSPKPEWLSDGDVGAFAAWIASEAGSMISGSVIELGPKPKI